MSTRPGVVVSAIANWAAYGIAAVVGFFLSPYVLHHLGNSGRDYTIDLEDMIEEVPSARQNLEAEAAQAQEFVEMLPPGKHPITSRNPEGGYNEIAIDMLTSKIRLMQEVYG